MCSSNTKSFLYANLFLCISIFFAESFSSCRVGNWNWMKWWKEAFLLLFFFCLLLKTDFFSPWSMYHHCWKLYIRVGRKILFFFFFLSFFFLQYLKYVLLKCSRNARHFSLSLSLCYIIDYLWLEKWCLSLKNPSNMVKLFLNGIKCLLFHIFNNAASQMGIGTE